MAHDLDVLEKKVLKIEREIIELRRNIQRAKRKKINLQDLIESIASHAKSSEDTTEMISKMRRRNIKW